MTSETIKSQDFLKFRPLLDRRRKYQGFPIAIVRILLCSINRNRVNKLSCCLATSPRQGLKVFSRMPKDSRTYPLRQRASPYSRDTRNAHDCRLKNRLGSIGDEREWEEARCPICMEHPHNAVLLLCSSHEKRCRPYVCNTNTHHSNCLDQFLKSPAANPTEHQMSRDLCGGQSEPKYICPLCRCEFTSWIVLELARKFMNGQKRSCSLETCDFSGTYPELRNHVNRVHPSLQPSEADPERLREWTKLEEERQFEDFLIHIQDGLGEDDLLRDIFLSVEEERSIEDLLIHIPDGLGGNDLLGAMSVSVGLVGLVDATSEPETSSDEFLSLLESDDLWEFLFF